MRHAIATVSLSGTLPQKQHAVAAARGLRLGFEAPAWDSHIRAHGHAWRIVEQAAHPHLGLMVERFHRLAIDDELAGIASIPGHRFFFELVQRLGDYDQYGTVNAPVRMAAQARLRDLRPAQSD